MYVGITGYMGSGKGELAKILMKRGFRYISLSDIVREETSKRKKTHSRENLQNIGNSLREKYGAGILGKRICEKISLAARGKNDWVIDGIRNPAEIEELSSLRDFHLIGVFASKETMLKRLLSRGRATEKKSTKKEIEDALNREFGEGESENGQQISACIDMADFVIRNENSLAELKQKLLHFFGLLDGTDRPTFDEVFMELAYVWSKRSTCLRRHVGAVVAKDKQQLTAGYNGAPKGIPHCAELGGCLREKLHVPSGTRHELCRGTHAEQNAITQAAKFGISIEGATMYCNASPCVICTKMIINAGIKKLVFDSEYNDPLAKEILGQQRVVELARYEGRRFHKEHGFTPAANSDNEPCCSCG